MLDTFMADRRLLCSCSSTLGFALLPKCPLCLGMALAGLGLAMPVSRTLLVVLMLCLPMAYVAVATYRTRRVLPLIAGAIAASLLFAGQTLAGMGLLLLALYISHMRRDIVRS